MKLRKITDNLHGIVDISVAITIGIVFAALMVIAYIIYTLRGSILPATPTTSSTAAYNYTYGELLNSTGNITLGFDNAVKLILIAITVAILAIALSYLMMLRRNQ